MISKSNLQICEATIGDIPYLVQLLEQLFSIEEDFQFNNEKHTQGLKLLIEDPNSVVAIGKFEGEIITMLTLQPLISTAIGAPSGLIEDFVVDKNYKGIGIGSLMLEYIKDKANEKGLQRLQLVCDNFNDNAQEFYKKKEFVKSNLTAWYLQKE